MIFTGIWVLLTIGIGIIHTDVILAGRITPEQDEKISGSYGRLCGGGIVLIWVFANLIRKRQSAEK